MRSQDAGVMHICQEAYVMIAHDRSCDDCVGRKEYEHRVPRDESLLHSLLAAKRKDTGQPLSESQICAQSFTFILAGRSICQICQCAYSKAAFFVSL